jgi:hypothetical protein
LTIAPEKARQTLQIIKDQKEYPDAANAFRHAAGAGPRNICSFLNSPMAMADGDGCVNQSRRAEPTSCSSSIPKVASSHTG